MKYAFAPISEALGQTVGSLRMDCSKVMQIAQAEEAVRANEYRKIANEARVLAEIEEKSELQTVHRKLRLI